MTPTTLMVTPFAPYRDGIATYAAQEIRARRDAGERIEIVSPAPSAAHHHLPLGGVRGTAMLVNLARGYQRVVIQYGPEILLGQCRSAAQRVSVWSAVVAIARLVPLELRIHEIEYQPLRDNPGERRLLRLLLRLADEVSVHTEPERELLRPLLGNAAVDRIQVIDHGRNFVPAVDCSADEAKLELGVPADVFTFLSIGFIQRHKGFDRSVEAFALAQLPNTQLHIVGSGRVDHPEIGAYVSELADVCAATEGAELHNRFVSDDQFDLWLVAADAVVLPYREIWSSSVVERARLFEKPVITSDLEQLRHQIGHEGYACTDVQEMALAMEKVWSESLHGRGMTDDDTSVSLHGRLATERGVPRRRASDLAKVGPAWEVDDNDPSQSAIQDQIIRRAGGTSIATPASADELATGSPSKRLAALGSLDRPEPVSARPGVAPAKQAVLRATGWQLDPMYQRIRDLQQATLEAVVEVENRLEALAAASDSANDDSSWVASDG